MTAIYVERGSVIVSGYSAAVIYDLLEKANREGRIDRLPPEPRREVHDTRRALGAAAVTWRRMVDAASAERNEETEQWVAEAQSESDVIDAREAAGMLDLTPRRVCQLAEVIGGRKIAGRWVFDADAVRAEAERRGAA